MKSYITKELPISALKSDKYQSPVNPLRVKRIKKNYVPQRMQTIDVSLRNGIYWIVDGQHRVAALKELGILTINCKIHLNLSYEEEANLYYELNSPKNRRTPTTIHCTNALLEAKDPMTTDIKRIAETNGFIFGMDQSKAIDKIVCHATLKKIYQGIGAIGLGRVLHLINATWGGIFEAVDSKLLMGLFAFVKFYDDDFTDKQFIKRLSKIQPSRVLSEGRSEISSTGAYIPYAKVILKYYNKGCSIKLPTNRF
jgi:hypothetical protein